jgi:hypothetical protein
VASGLDALPGRELNLLHPVFGKEYAMNKKVIGAVLLLLFGDMVKNSFVPIGAIGGIVASAIPLGSIVGAGALLWSAARQSLTQAIVDAIAERFPRPQ